MFTNKKEILEYFYTKHLNQIRPKVKKKIKKNKNHYNDNMKKTPKMLQKIGNRYVT